MKNAELSRIIAIAFFAATVAHLATGAVVQVGSRFPLGINVNGSATCESATDAGLLRFHNNVVQVCNESIQWQTLASQEQVAALNEELMELRGVNGSISPELVSEMRDSNQFAAIAMCNNHGEFDLESKTCQCFCSGALGCWDSVSQCTSCASGWTGTYCRVDVEAPVLTVLGDNPLTIEAGAGFVDPGAIAHDNRDGDITALIIVSHNVVDDTVGSYEVSFSVSDEAEHETTATRTVEVVDTTPPTISLVGDNPITIEAAADVAYTGPTVVVADNAVGALNWSSNFSAVNFQVPGAYIVSYELVDEASNVATPALLYIDVVDTTPPVVTLIGDNPFLQMKGYPYQEQSVSIEENALGYDLQTISDVNAGVIGNYTVTYVVTDSSGLQTNASRTVVVDDFPGNSPLNKALSCQHVFDSVSNPGNGTYYVNPFPASSEAFPVTCEFTAEAGWTLCVVRTSTDTSDGDWANNECESIQGTQVRLDVPSFGGQFFSEVSATPFTLRTVQMPGGGAHTRRIGTTRSILYDHANGDNQGHWLQLDTQSDTNISPVEVCGSGCLHSVGASIAIYDPVQDVIAGDFGHPYDGVIVCYGYGASHNDARCDSGYPGTEDRYFFKDVSDSQVAYRVYIGSPKRSSSVGESQSNPAFSCEDVLAAAGEGVPANGTYWLDPTGSSTADAFETQCEFAEDGSQAWTLCVSRGNSAANNDDWSANKCTAVSGNQISMRIPWSGDVVSSTVSQVPFSLPTVTSSGKTRLGHTQSIAYYHSPGANEGQYIQLAVNADSSISVTEGCGGGCNHASISGIAIYDPETDVLAGDVGHSYDGVAICRSYGGSHDDSRCDNSYAAGDLDLRLFGAPNTTTMYELWMTNAPRSGAGLSSASPAVSCADVLENSEGIPADASYFIDPNGYPYGDAQSTPCTFAADGSVAWTKCFTKRMRNDNDDWGTNFCTNVNGNVVRMEFERAPDNMISETSLTPFNIPTLTSDGALVVLGTTRSIVYRHPYGANQGQYITLSNSNSYIQVTEQCGSGCYGGGLSALALYDPTADSLGGDMGHAYNGIVVCRSYLGSHPGARCDGAYPGTEYLEYYKDVSDTEPAYVVYIGTKY